MATDSGYIKGDFKRQCDICGHRWFFKRDLKYIGQNRWACPDDVEGLTAEQIARHNSRVRPLVVKQHKHPRLPSQIGTYQFREGVVLNAICDLAVTASSASANGGVVISATVESAAWCGIYLGDLLEENQRPTLWLTRARATLLSVCTFLRSRQYGDTSSVNAAEPTNSILYGALAEPATGSPRLTSSEIALAGLTFLRAYRVTGDATHLASADRVAWWLRQCQRCDLSTCGTQDQSGNRYYIAGWTWFMSFAKAVHSNFTIEGAVALWFLKELKAIRGGDYVYGTTSAVGDFVSAPSGSIDTMMADAMAFYFNGHALPASSNTPVFSPPPTAPWAYYSNFTGPGGVTGDFAFHLDGGVSVTGLNYAYALRGLFEVEGYTDRVAAALAWLLAFTSNPSFEPADGATTYTKVNGGLGAYDPTFAFASTLLLVKGGVSVTMNGTNTYDLRISGLLGPVMEAARTSLVPLKDFLENDRRRRVAPTEGGSDVGSPLRSGVTTMALAATTQNTLPGYASATAQVYRQAPKVNNTLENPAA